MDQVVDQVVDLDAQPAVFHFVVKEIMVVLVK